MRSRTVLTLAFPALLLSGAVSVYVHQDPDASRAKPTTDLKRSESQTHSRSLHDPTSSRPIKLAAKTSDEPDVVASGQSRPSTLSPEVDALAGPDYPRTKEEIAAAFYKAVGPVLARSLPEERRQQIFERFQDRLSAPLEPYAYLCWSEGTEIQVVEASHRAEMAVQQRIQSSFSVQAFQSLGSGRWSWTAIDGNTGSYGTPITLTWSFPPDGTLTDEGEPSDLIARLDEIYPDPNPGPPGNGNSIPTDFSERPWFPIFQAAFENISAETGLMFVYEPEDDGAAMTSSNDGSQGVRGDLRILGARIDGNSGTLAYNYSPGYGDMVIDTDDSFFTNTSNSSRRLQNTIEHEFGHGLGLAHVCPVNGTKLMEPFINLGFVGIQFDDTYSLQRRYGDHFERAGDIVDNDSVLNATQLPVVANTLETVDKILSIDDDSDVDFFGIQLQAGQGLIATVTPTDESYLEGGQDSNGDCGGETFYDFSSNHDLKLTVIGPDEVSELATSNSAPAGDPESVGAAATSTGIHYLKVEGDSSNNAQIYSLELEVFDADTLLTLSTPDPTADEDDGTNTASVVVSSSNPVASDLTVTLIPSGDADSADYTGSLTATIPAGQFQSSPVVITATPDGELEGNETLTLTLPPYVSGDVSYSFGTPSSTNLDLLDSPTPLFTLGSVTQIQESFSLQNGYFDPGETAVVSIQVGNAGTAAATNVSGTLTGPAGFVPFTATAAYGTIAESGMAASPFTFALNGTCGDDLELNLALSSDEGTTANLPITITLGPPASSTVEDFELAGALPTGWSTSDSGVGSGWSAVTNQSTSGSYSVFAENPGSTGASILTSPSVTLPDPAGEISFRHYYDTESGWDGGVLEVSVNGGNWEDIEDSGATITAGGYNLVLNPSTNTLTGRSAWSGDSGGFVLTTVDLPPSMAGQEVRLRWIMGSDGFFSAEGWYIDDFSIPSMQACDETGPALVFTQSGAQVSEADAELTTELTISTNPALPTANPIAFTINNSGSADAANDVTGLDSQSIAFGQSAAVLLVSAVDDDEVEGDETLELTIPGVTGSASIVVSDSAYGTWAAANLGTSGEVLPGDDADGDGFFNVEEFAFDTLADDPDSTPASEPVVNDGFLEIMAPQEPLPAGLSVIGQTSTDATNWTTEGVIETDDGFKVPLTGPQRFLRLAYTFGD